MKNVIDVLQERGFIEAISSEELRKCVEKPLTIYCGFDPTADSLHLGHLVPMMGLAWFQKFGHTPIAIVGGATGMIGDPSGKSMERQLLDAETIEKNVAGIRKNLQTCLDFAHPTAKPQLLNNLDWFKNFAFIDFLREIGKHFRLGVMLSKDSVKNRLNSEEGMSFTEFSYQLLQGYDFLHLYDNYNVSIQLGGSDQWGNILAGTDLIRKMRGQPAYGVTFPLLTRSDGQKFGKSEKGAIWLSADKLTPYEFYQYMFRIPDADVIKLMKMLTFMEMSDILHYQHAMRQADYLPNSAQKRLAEEVTRIVHGEAGLEVAVRATKAAAPGSDTLLDASSLDAIAQDIPNHDLKRSELVGYKLVDLIASLGLQPSKGEARRLIKNGGVYINNLKITDENASFSDEHLIEDRMLLLAVGKKNKVLLRVQS